ncbi:cobalt-precorrin-5B (C(1))-methyltransferase CbiD [Peptacetobacter hiranonis]|uniref:cobalt-precorrin-5B (C(1))-methyltransferase CbiD n=1 Tax=Peptacetobacter hiranonis TaxID=89152 RepID=UPI002E7958A3|nr:cobalt-precorrin-5B (C(1))-methyltransferase CbiD [Peptacetobacter hiranonis]MEE0248314.1 cobalt-precorrin-5B (C(1))-methyltransferase CbiD [Peptacetobacter hiranonis]
MEEFVYIDGKKYRRGYTTGSCATAVSKAAVYMILTNEKIDTVNIDTPKGIYLSIPVVSSEIKKNEDTGEVYSICSVEKDGGDDIDATNGIEIFAKATWVYKDEIDKSEKNFSFEGDGFCVFSGDGVGIITKKGLSIEPGRPAINPVPQKMIAKEVESVLKASEESILKNNSNERKRIIKITIFIPKGEEVSNKTFNPRLGIVGGISIIGTSGIVEPMSDDGWKKSLSIELNMKKELGMDKIILVPGNHGESFISDRIGENSSVVRTSNFLGYMLMEAKRMGFKKILLAGHIGKFIKLSAGIFNTHSKVADARNEILIANLALMGASTELVRKIDSCLTTEEATDIVYENGFGEVFDIICEKCKKRAEMHVDNEIEIEVFIFKMDKTVLGKSKNAEEMLDSFRK